MSKGTKRWTHEMRRILWWIEHEEHWYSRYSELSTPSESLKKHLVKREGKIAGYKMAFNLLLGKRRFSEVLPVERKINVLY